MKIRPGMHRFLITSVLFAMLLVGCDQQAMFEKLAPAQEVTIAKDLIAKLAERDFTSVEARLGGSLRTPDTRAKLEQIANLIPVEKPKAVRTVGANTMSMNSITTYKLTFEYGYRDQWLIVDTVLERRDDRLTLEGIHVTPAQQSLEAQNRFSFEGKGPLHYLVFAFAIAIPLFVIYTLVVCARTRITKRKWLWLLFVAVGFVQFNFNWTTGAWDLLPIAFSVLGAGFGKMGPVAPWVFTLAFPLGAVIFLVRRRSIQSAHEA
jgi:hypothetical protein